MASMSCRASLKRYLSSSLQKRYYSAPTDGAIPPAKAKYVPSSGTYPKGFLAGSAHAGVKPSNTRFDDIALIVSETPAAAAAVFTTNVFKAAPVQISSKVLTENAGQNISAVVVNSGCANAVTGKGGLEDAIAMARASDSLIAPAQAEAETKVEAESKAEAKVEDALGLKSLVMSTGVIGQRLPIDKITAKIPEAHASLGSSHDHWLRAARAICTTDTFPKLVSKTFTLPSHPETTYSIAGMTKGAGMIHPNMATLLSIICTDAPVQHTALRALLKEATEQSFNSISIDGDTSTNDTCALLANGAAAPEHAKPIEVVIPTVPQKSPRGKTLSHTKVEQRRRPVLDNQSADYQAFDGVLKDFMVDLAKLVVRDGEGATKFVTIRVEGARHQRSAKRIAETIATSALVKTALYGKDANWGRILCAIGYAPGKNVSAPEHTSVSFVPTDGSEELKLLVRGEPEQVDEERAKTILEMEDLEILVRLNDGAEDKIKQPNSCVFWTCDFSHEYVTINGDYRT